MPSAKIDSIVHAYLQALTNEGIIVEQAYLYGSQAREEAEPESDIDLIVVSKSFTHIPAPEQWKKLGKAALAIMEPVEVLPYTPEEVEANLKKEGGFLRHVLSRPDTVEYKVYQT
ncbi:MAG: nucleotidyltransferase domain-containing protein [Firmicutes bacterium]|nr:nucleotidyltransferase domain-containing protein [Bacillota bacterium]